MIVIGVDVHKRTVTAVAVDDAGRMLEERTVAVGSEELIGWASALDAVRLKSEGQVLHSHKPAVRAWRDS